MPVHTQVGIAVKLPELMFSVYVPALARVMLETHEPL